MELQLLVMAAMMAIGNLQLQPAKDVIQTVLHVQFPHLLVSHAQDQPICIQRNAEPYVLKEHMLMMLPKSVKLAMPPAKPAQDLILLIVHHASMEPILHLQIHVMLAMVIAILAVILQLNA